MTYRWNYKREFIVCGGTWFYKSEFTTATLNVSYHPFNCNRLKAFRIIKQNC